MANLNQKLADRERERQALEERVFAAKRGRDEFKAAAVEEPHPMQADLAPLPFWHRAIVIVALAAATWASVWIVARGVIWIARVW